MIGIGDKKRFSKCISVGGITGLCHTESQEIAEESTPEAETLLPIADGTRTQFETVAGPSRHEALADDSDETYIRTALSYKINSVKFNPVESVAKEVSSVVFNIRACSNQTEIITMTSSLVGLYSQAISIGSDSEMLTSSFEYFTNPGTDLPWTIDEIIGTSFGIKTSSLETDELITCSKMWLVVNYQ